MSGSRSPFFVWLLRPEPRLTRLRYQAWSASLKIKYFFPNRFSAPTFHPLVLRFPRFPICFSTCTLSSRGIQFSPGRHDRKRATDMSFFLLFRAGSSSPRARRDSDGRPEMKRTVKGAGSFRGNRNAKRRRVAAGIKTGPGDGKLINGGLSSARAIKARKKRLNFRFRSKPSLSCGSIVR